MREVKEGDIIEIDGEIHLIQNVAGVLQALDLKRASGFIQDVPDHVNFVTSIKYLKRSINESEVKSAKSILQEHGHQVDYLADGMYVIDRHTAKANYKTGAGLIALSEEVSRRSEEKKAQTQEKRKKSIERRDKQDEKQTKANSGTAERTSKIGRRKSSKREVKESEANQLLND